MGLRVLPDSAGRGGASESRCTVPTVGAASQHDDDTAREPPLHLRQAPGPGMVSSTPTAQAPLHDPEAASAAIHGRKAVAALAGATAAQRPLDADESTDYPLKQRLLPASLSAAPDDATRSGPRQ